MVRAARPLSRSPAWRRLAARWLAWLVLGTALGPLVSGALLQQAHAAACAAHAAHGMACDAAAPQGVHAHGGPHDGGAAQRAGFAHHGHGHCDLCLLAQTPPITPAAPTTARPFAQAPGRPPARATPPAGADRAARWLLARLHAPPGRG